MHPLFVIDNIERPRLLHLLPQIDDGTEDVGLGMVDVAGQPGSPRVSARKEKEVGYRRQSTDLPSDRREGCHATCARRKRCSS